jgi:hypothetical protein
MTVNIIMESTQTKAKLPNKFKPSSFYHKYQCDSCYYFTNYKNSFNKHIKSAKHLALNPIKEEVQTNTDVNVVESENQIIRETVDEDLQTEVVMDASMGFITVEEVKKEIVNEDTISYNEYQMSKIVDLMDKLNNKINDDVEIKCVYFGLGFLFHLVFFNLLVGGQWSNFFELSG